MTQRYLAMTACSCFVLAAIGCGADVAEVVDESSLSSPLLSCDNDLPPAIVVPDGQRLAFRLAARGVQIYTCQAAADGTSSWVFTEPEADLYGPRGKVAVGHHFAGPTWEANDGSSVVGTKLAAATVDAASIPWLLLQASSHNGEGLMTPITYVQRLDTHGGLAPTGTCEVGTKLEVDYTANYAFYVAKPAHH
jgi:hypothetical protein